MFNLKACRAREKELIATVRTLGDKFKRDGNRWLDPDEAKRFEQASDEAESLRKERNAYLQAYAKNNFSNNSQLDLALKAWVRNQNGIPITPAEATACENYGIAANSNVFSARFAASRPSRGAGIFVPREQRDGNVKGTNSLGGFTVPQGFFPNLERAMLSFAGMLDTAEVIKTADGRDMPWPHTDDTGNAGTMLAEAAHVDTTEVTFGATTFKAWKATSGMVICSSELLRDNGIDLAGQLGAILGERLGRIVNTKCTTGAGTTEPKGIVTCATLGKTAASATAITMDELLDLVHSVDVAYRSSAYGCGFMMSDSVAKYLRKLKDSDGRYLWADSPIYGQPSTLLGWPVTINNDMASAVTTGQKTVLFGAMQKFKIRLVNDIRLRRLEERYADFDQVGFVGFMEFDSNLIDGGGGAIKYLQQA